jgi:hypothetical protein
LKGDFWARRASYATDGAGSCAELWQERAADTLPLIERLV